ncbi:MAG: Trk system potassium transporter TrkA [Clostridia bacterium]|nr:Trk system potassium transporter TrkA [Clostridia bacterium]
MNIVIVGCGKIGSTILSDLLSEGHDIVAVDSDPQVISEISNIYDSMYVCGSGTNCDTLVEAGVERAELFIAATGSDECNMLSCFIAKRMGAKHTIARVRNPEYSEKSFGFMRQQLDISMIMNPDQLAAQDMYYTLKLPGAVKIEYFARRSFEMVELRLKEDSPLCGVKLHELRKSYDAKFLICAVQRGDSVVIPDGNYVLEPGDRIELTAAPSEISKLLKLLGILRKQSRSVMILGASRAAYYLTRMLLASGTGVTVIERDHQRCQHFSELLPGATVICDDGSKQELLMAEGLTSRDAFVSLTGMDEENILVSFFALSQGLPKVITKVNRDELHATAERLGLDSLIASRHVSSNVVSRYARALQNSLGSNMEALYRILDGKAEAIEFAVHSDCVLTGIPLSEMRLRSGILIAGIIRGRKTIIPSGTDCIYVGDHIIVLAAGMQIHQLTDILLP